VGFVAHLRFKAGVGLHGGVVVLVEAVWPLLQPPGVTAGRFFCVC